MSKALVPADARRQQFEAWVAEYSAPVLRTCYVYLADRALAEDALQDTFVKVWRKMDSFEGRNGASPKSWIIRIAINTCKSYRMSAWWRRVDRSAILENLPDPIAEDGSRELFLTVMQLPDKLRQAVLLYHYNDLTMAEAADILGISRPAVHNRLNKAYALLRTQLEGDTTDEA